MSKRREPHVKHDLRVTLTKRMLEEGLMRCLENKPLSRITVSELCREAGVNRATFYNHYQSPAMVLRDITRDYAADLQKVYEASMLSCPGDQVKATEACFEFIDQRRADIQVLFSDNAENNVVRFEEELVDEIVSRDVDPLYWKPGQGNDNRLVYAIVTASASYGLVRAWILGKIDKTPAELASMLDSIFGDGSA